MKKDINSKYPLRHLTVRVPWHDSGWIGKVCDSPSSNVACMKLENILKGKDIEKEDSIAGKSIETLSDEELNLIPCIRERATFMAPFQHFIEVNHPYQLTSKKTHGHFRSTKLRVPPYSIMTLPFQWMSLEFGKDNSDKFDFAFDEQSEKLLALDFESSWMQTFENQKATQDAFFGHIYPEDSLVFIYAKQVPYVESNERILVGIGRIREVGLNTPYNTEKKGQSTCLVWERPVQHTIRPDFKDGFLFPLKEIFDRASVNEKFNAEDFIIKIPDSLRENFSFGSEHLRNDGAIQVLTKAQEVLQKISNEFEGPWLDCLSWVNSEASRLKKERGLRPGLGASLTAFGLKNGTFVAWELQQQTIDGDDPWVFLDKMFNSPKEYLSERLAKSISKTYQRAWKELPSEELLLLKVMSRIDLTPSQAETLYSIANGDKNSLGMTIKEILENPYKIYEGSRLSNDPISFETVDLGLIQNFEALDENEKLIDGHDDPRRIRALGIRILETASNDGHTVLPKAIFYEFLKNHSIQNPPTINSPIMRLAEKEFKGAIEVLSSKYSETLYQLSRIHSFSSIISNGVKELLSRGRHDVNADWASLLANELGEIEKDEHEARARQEKALALKELAESPVSVLIGPAGTGKTTMLKVLCDQPSIKAGGILLLAPTGKARVKLQTKSKIETKTLAQFLGDCDRFDYETQRYKLSAEKNINVCRTVIVDECSMLTEEMLGALLQGINGYHRLILVGDHDQLPPIGPGKPFVDIIHYLRPENVANIFPKVSKGYCELTVPRRQKELANESLDDLKLAQWFRSSPTEVDSDEILSISNKKSNRLRLVEWKNEKEIPRLLNNLLCEELQLNEENLHESFNLSLGATKAEKGAFFNMGAGLSAENWQILSPTRGMLTGTSELNRNIHEQYRRGTIEFAHRKRQIPKPMGPEQIIYGDKVINTKNHHRGKKYDGDKYPQVYPLDESALQYVANGEVGIVTGRFVKAGTKQPWQISINFSSQPKHNYSYTSSDFKEESEPILELAYALTVHKCQGSEFKVVFLVLPNPCRLLSREMLYTSLTRQQDKLIILHQGSFQDMLRFSSPSRSDNAKRLTNLFLEPMPRSFEGSFLDANLIHIAEDGTPLRSKSELFIYERLKMNGIDVQYERHLRLGEKLIVPDFTIDRPAKGGSIYWEHAGMMDDPNYKARWLKKKEAYHKNGIGILDEGGGPNGILVFTEDSYRKGLITSELDEIIEKVKRLL